MIVGTTTPDKRDDRVPAIAFEIINTSGAKRIFTFFLPAIYNIVLNDANPYMLAECFKFSMPSSSRRKALYDHESYLFESSKVVCDSNLSFAGATRVPKTLPHVDVHILRSGDHTTTQ
jgi:hypothetical protein